MTEKISNKKKAKNVLATMEDPYIKLVKTIKTLQ